MSRRSKLIYSYLLQIVYEHFLTVAGFLLALLLAARVLQEKRQPGSTLAWLLAIVLIPYLGVPLYLVFGGRKMNQFIRSKGKLYDQENLDEGGESKLAAAARIVIAAGMPPPRAGNHVVQHHNGETAFHALMALCESAQECIHVSTFILGRDETGRAVIEMLARKAREGVQVRLLLDGLGCLWAGGRFTKPLRDAGGQVGRFLPVLPLQWRWSANLRNHRKIVVVDHCAAMVGGMNLATSFMGATPKRRRFVDSTAFLCGSAVADIEDVFFHDWNYAVDERMTSCGEASPADRIETFIQAISLPSPEVSPASASLVQVVPSGPDVEEDTFHDALITAIMEAQERIWLVTPYFVPDESLVKMLALKARTGCDVCVLLPLRSNHPTADLARGSVLRQITAAGGTVYAYPGNMVHAKLMVFDETMAITGSPNLDMRSIYLNFEIALFHYSQQEIAYCAEWIRTLQNASHMIRPEGVSKSRAWAESFCRLISPLL
ncbi:MAG: PLDc N-terminal domain-containing protein [Candidatus Hydrogenedentes bacterium]|nr:PLDc N-terminal domain-containing protein [Candidatus Hydrogenedentota bacterium]